MQEALSPAYVRAILDYDAATGELRWRERSVDMFAFPGGEKVCEVYNRDFAGKVAGTVQKSGYRTLYISGRNYFAHRVIWLIVHGKWPDNQIDHINRVKSDNRLENLRDVTGQINSWNVDHSGFSGATWDKHKRRWKSSITHAGKTIFLGRYRDRDAAIAAYQRAVQDKRGYVIGRDEKRAAAS